MPLPHRDPAITAYVRHVLIGVDNNEPTKVAARLGVSGAWVVNVRDSHRGVGLDSLRKIAQAHFEGSLDRLEAAARAWAAEHPELLAGSKSGSVNHLVPQGSKQLRSHQLGSHQLGSPPFEKQAFSTNVSEPRKGKEARRGLTSSPAPQLENLRAARERLLDRGYPRDAINEALLNTAVEDSSDVLLVFDRAERHLIAQGYAAQLEKLLRQGRRGVLNSRTTGTPRTQELASPADRSSADQSSAPQSSASKTFGPETSDQSSAQPSPRTPSAGSKGTPSRPRRSRKPRA